MGNNQSTTTHVDPTLNPKHAAQTSWTSEAVFLGLGLLSGLGFHLSGMDLPQRTLAFFDLLRIPAGTWDNSLLITFISATLSHLVVYYLVRWLRSKPLFSKEWSIPHHSDIDKPLLVGSTLFGIGWGISGQCPGPAFAAFNRFQPSSLIYAVGMFLGFIAIEQYRNGFTLEEYKKSKSVTYGLGAVSLLGLWVYIGQKYGIAWEGPAPTPQMTSLGGALIGLSIGLSMLLYGRILGNSGMLKGIFSPSHDDKALRSTFLLGILGAGTLSQFLLPGPAMVNSNPHWLTFLGGLLVGVGTSLGNGCTSGHGICGIARMSRRSIIATCCFFVTCGVTVSLRSYLKL